MVKNELEIIKEKANSLAASSIFGDESELYTLFQKAETTLASQMEEGRPIAEDPELAMEAFKMIAKANIDLLEAKRRALDTLLKAKAVLDGPKPEPASNTVDPLNITEPVDQSTASNGAFADIS